MSAPQKAERRVGRGGVVERRCAGCGEWKPEHRDFTIKRYRKTDGRAVRYGKCKRCEADRVLAWEDARATDAEWVEHRRQVSRRHDQRRVDLMRMDRILRAERRGEGLPEVEPTKVQGGHAASEDIPALPSWPLYAKIKALIDVEERGNALRDPIKRPDHAHCLGATASMCAWLRIETRTFTGWGSGERPRVLFDIVDRALARSPWLWWDVYNEQTVRLRLEVRLYGYRIERAGKPRTRDRVGTAWYGDWGPDLKTLAMIEEAFTSEEVPEAEERVARLAEAEEAPAEPIMGRTIDEYREAKAVRKSGGGRARQGQAA